MSDTKIPNYPRIFLQPNEAGIGEHTWCQDRIEDTDIEYIRSDIADELLVALDELVECLTVGYVPQKDGSMLNEARALIAKAGGQP